MKKIDYYFKKYKISIILLIIITFITFIIFIIFLLYNFYINIEKNNKINYKNNYKLEHFVDNNIVTPMPNNNNFNIRSSSSEQIFDYGIEEMSTNSLNTGKENKKELETTTMPITTPANNSPIFYKINFHKLFNNPPKVFTQIILNDANNTENVMTVNVFNITPNSFNYTVRGVSNKSIGSSGKMKGIMLNNNYPVKFSWMAIG